MAGSYYDQDRTKRLLGIGTGDSADDVLLDELGAVANQHTDNILKIHDEKIPLSTDALNDIKHAAACYTASLFKARQEDPEMAKFWKTNFDDIIAGYIQEKEVTGQPYIVERHNSYYQTGMEDVYALW